MGVSWLAAGRIAAAPWEILPPFDPAISCNSAEDGLWGMDTYAAAVAHDGKTIVGYAQKHLSTQIDEDGDCSPVTETVAFKWQNGSYTP